MHIWFSVVLDNVWGSVGCAVGSNVHLHAFCWLPRWLFLCERAQLQEPTARLHWQNSRLRRRDLRRQISRKIIISHNSARKPFDLTIATRCTVQFVVFRVCGKRYKKKGDITIIVFNTQNVIYSLVFLNRRCKHFDLLNTNLYISVCLWSVKKRSDFIKVLCFMKIVIISIFAINDVYI